MRTTDGGCIPETGEVLIFGDGGSAPGRPGDETEDGVGDAIEIGLIDCRRVAASAWGWSRADVFLPIQPLGRAESISFRDLVRLGLVEIATRVEGGQRDGAHR